MEQKPISTHALAKLIAIVKAHIESDTQTDVTALAEQLQQDIPGLNHNQIERLIVSTISLMRGARAAQTDTLQ